MFCQKLFAVTYTEKKSGLLCVPACIAGVCADALKRVFRFNLVSNLVSCAKVFCRRLASVCLVSFVQSLSFCFFGVHQHKC
jgi:hypothetical protein